MNTMTMIAGSHASQTHTPSKTRKQPRPLREILLPAAGLVPMSLEYVEAHKEKLKLDHGIKEPHFKLEQMLVRLLNNDDMTYFLTIVASFIVGAGSIIILAFLVIAKIVVSVYSMIAHGPAAALSSLGSFGPIHITLLAAFVLCGIVLTYCNRLENLTVVDWDRMSLKKWRKHNSVPTKILDIVSRIQYYADTHGIQVAYRVEYPRCTRLPDPFLVLEHEQGGVKEEVYVVAWV